MRNKRKHRIKAQISLTQRFETWIVDIIEQEIRKKTVFKAYL